MLTAARLREDVAPAHLDWITALRAPQVNKLVRGGDLQLTLFDVQDLAEITSPDFPGQRLIACKNPFLEAERARKRESLLAATEAALEKIAAACARARRPLHGQDKIAVRADRVLNRRKVAKHFTVGIGEGHLSYHRNQDSITAEAALDGIYVLRTSVDASSLDSGAVVSYKALAQVERAFRAFNTDLDIRPIRHRTEDRFCAHVFLRMLSYYLSWHMQARLAPLLFTDDDKPAARAPAPARSLSCLPLPARPGQGRHQADPGRPARAQLRHPARRPRHDLPEHHRAGRPRAARLPARHHSHRSPAAGLRAARRQPPPRGRVVSTPAPPTPKAQVNSPTPDHRELRANRGGPRSPMGGTAGGTGIRRRA